MSDDDVPELDDFSNELGQIQQTKKESNIDLGDYTKPKEQIQDINENSIRREDTLLPGLKKGFLNDQPKKQPLKEDPDIIKPKEKKKNPLEIKEVQQNMNMETGAGQFLTNNKDKWLSEDLLSKVSTNEKLIKLFSNPEYMQAIQLMQSKPKETMMKYQNNPEFMMLFQEFAKVMGTHFEGLDQKDKGQQQPQQPKQQNIVEIKAEQPKQKQQKTQEEIIYDLIQNDPEVVSILKEPKVVAFIEYLQKTGRVDFHQMVQADPDLARKLGVLIKKGVLNLQGV